MSRWKELRDNPILRERMRQRSAIVAGVRKFFVSRDFLEVETPLLVRHPGMEPYLTPFVTTVQQVSGRPERAYLITSPEYAMKKLLAAGYERIFEICKTFRNDEGFGGTHNPEFTMIEWYRTKADYRDIMQDTEDLVITIAQEQATFPLLSYGERTIDLTPPWPRMTMREAWREALGTELNDLLSREAMGEFAVSRGHHIAPTDDFDDCFFKVFLNEIEPRLGTFGAQERPVFLYEYPASMAALSERTPADPRYAERFEVYIGGLELGNGFTELRDHREQRERFEEERTLRRKLGKEPFAIDEDFIDALRSGFPRSGGIALGIDRLVMIIMNARNINDVLFFPAEEIFD